MGNLGVGAIMTHEEEKQVNTSSSSSLLRRIQSRRSLQSPAIQGKQQLSVNATTVKTLIHRQASSEDEDDMESRVKFFSKNSKSSRRTR